jgi:ubiquinone/menaquinone biosynthesis C-methylase UbiE
MWDKPEYRVVSPGEMVAKEFLRQAKPKNGESVIDLGCGTGRGSKALAFLVT